MQDLYGDTSRLCAELDYDETVDRREGVRRSIAWELEQQRDEPSPDYLNEDAALLAHRETRVI